MDQAFLHRAVFDSNPGHRAIKRRMSRRIRMFLVQTYSGLYRHFRSKLSDCGSVVLTSLHSTYLVVFQFTEYFFILFLHPSCFLISFTLFSSFSFDLLSLLQIRTSSLGDLEAQHLASIPTREVWFLFRMLRMHTVPFTRYASSETLHIGRAVLLASFPSQVVFGPTGVVMDFRAPTRAEREEMARGSRKAVPRDADDLE